MNTIDIPTVTNEGKIIDTKIVENRDGFIYHIWRTRSGLIDTISMSYWMKSGIKTRTARIPSFMGWFAQLTYEIAIDIM